MGAPEPPSDIGVVQVELPQEAVPLYTAHGLLRHAQPLGDRVDVVGRHVV
jgi:hypothetical protein